MTPLYIVITITGALVLAAALIAAFFLGRWVDRSRSRREHRGIKKEIDRLLEIDEFDMYK